MRFMKKKINIHKINIINFYEHQSDNIMIVCLIYVSYSFFMNILRLELLLFSLIFIQLSSDYVKSVTESRCWPNSLWQMQIIEIVVSYSKQGLLL